MSGYIGRPHLTWLEGEGSLSNAGSWRGRPRRWASGSPELEWPHQLPLLRTLRGCSQRQKLAVFHVRFQLIVNDPAPGWDDSPTPSPTIVRFLPVGGYSPQDRAGLHLRSRCSADCFYSNLRSFPRKNGAVLSACGPYSIGNWRDAHTRMPTNRGEGLYQTFST